jgi:hypothetical protein
MNLIYCQNCGDIVRVFHGVERECACGASWAETVDATIVRAGGAAIVVRVDDRSLSQALSHRSQRSPFHMAISARLMPVGSPQVMLAERPG